MKTYGIDVSTHQDDSRTPKVIDWTRPKMRGVRFVIHRAVYGADIDADFLTNWPRIRENGYLRGAYGFWDYTAGNPGPEAQARAFAAVMRPDPGDMPVHWGDFEYPGFGYPALPSRISCLDQMKRYIFTLEDASGRAGGFYMNGAMIQYLMSDNGRRVELPAWMRERELWLASWPTIPAGWSLENYIETTGWTPYLYGQWQKYRFWQAGTPAYGLEMGMESKDIDFDVFDGSETDLRAWCSLAPAEPDDGGSVMDWTKNAVGLYTKTAGWTNPAFDFIVGYAGGDWSKSGSGLVLEPNPALAPIEAQAHKEGKPFLALWDVDVDYYRRQQYDASEASWPNEARDYPYQRLISALSNRNVDGLIIRMMNYKNYDGGAEDLAYVAFAAQKFIERANKWLYTVKGLDRWTFVLTSDDFMHARPNGAESKHEYFYRWTKDWWLGIEQEAARPLKQSAWPQDPDKIRAVPPSLGWKLWYHYNATTLDMMIWNGTAAEMRAFLKFTGGATPADTTAPTAPTGLTATVSGQSVTLAWQPSTDNKGVAGYRVYQDSTLSHTTTSLVVTLAGRSPGTHVYQVEAYDAASNTSPKSNAVSVVISAPETGELEALKQRVTAAEAKLAALEGWKTELIRAISGG